MPKRKEDDLQYDFDETEDEEYDEDEDEDEEGDEDEEYDEDEDEDKPSGGLLRKILFGLLGVVVLGAGGFYLYTNYFGGGEAVTPPAPQASGQFANPNGLGKVPPEAASAVAEVPASASKPAVSPATPAPVAAKPSPPTAVSVHAHANAEQPPKVAAKPVTVRVAPQPPKALPVAHRAPRHAVHPLVHPAARTAARSAARHVASQAVVKSGSGAYSVQCGAFSSADLASRLSSVLNGKGFQARVSNGGGKASGAYSVRSTAVNSRAKADTLKAKFANAGHPGAIVGAGRGRYVLQLGIFNSRGPADSLAKELKNKGMFVSVSGGKARLRSVNRVLVGRFASMGLAQSAASRIRHQGVPAIVVKGY